MASVHETKPFEILREKYRVFIKQCPASCDRIKFYVELTGTVSGISCTYQVSYVALTFRDESPKYDVINQPREKQSIENCNNPDLNADTSALVSG